MMGREGLTHLLETARGKSRPFDCLLVEDTSRLARDLADALRMTAMLQFHGVAVVSVTQGIDSTEANARQLITLHGMVDEQYLIGLRDKVHRGQHGRVLNGMIPGGRCYGYRNIPLEDPSRTGKYGRPAVLGVRQEIEENEANVVRGIFEWYAGGMGLAQIAKRLNQQGAPAPIPAKNRLVRAWSRYTIREMLHNERYRGILVWDRTKKVRHPETGRKISKARPESEWTRVEVPALRIVPEELWKAAHAKNAEVNALGISRLGGLCRTQQSRTYLFSGILGCGQCGSSMVIVSGGANAGT
jgi:DNA invertase Pin-like site-specific DNA recombinase